MKRFDDISDINTDTDTGKMFFAAISILSGTDFAKEDEIYGPDCSKEEVVSEIVRISNYVYYETTSQEGEINPIIDESTDDGKLLLTAIDVLTSSECRNRNKYGGHKYVNDIVVDIFEMSNKARRNSQIDLIVLQKNYMFIRYEFNKIVI